MIFWMAIATKTKRLAVVRFNPIHTHTPSTPLQRQTHSTLLRIVCEKGALYAN